jgi:hypothetical protein
MTVFGFMQYWEDVIFFKYHFINKGSKPLLDAYTAIWMDPDIGYYHDDYAGCDSALGLAFAYNGDDFDDVYGYDIPALGCDILQGPMVDSPGDTAFFPDGSVYPDKKILGMTAFFLTGI